MAPRYTIFWEVDNWTSGTHGSSLLAIPLNQCPPSNHTPAQCRVALSRLAGLPWEDPNQPLKKHNRDSIRASHRSHIGPIEVGMGDVIHETELRFYAFEITNTLFIYKQGREGQSFMTELTSITLLTSKQRGKFGLTQNENASRAFKRRVRSQLYHHSTPDTRPTPRSANRWNKTGVRSSPAPEQPGQVSSIFALAITPP